MKRLILTIMAGRTFHQVESIGQRCGEVFRVRGGGPVVILHNRDSSIQLQRE